MTQRQALLLCTALLMLTGCAVPVDPLEQPAEEIEVEQIPEASPVECPPTAIPTVLSCPTAAPPETPEAGLRSVFVSSSSLTLRSGPSIAHPALATFPLGAAVKILAKAPGGSWVAVSVPGGQLGWMYTAYLGVEIGDPLDDVAEVEPAQSRVIEGYVVDDSGEPVANVGVQVALGGAVDYPDFTDADGRFALFVPDSQSGPWVVSIQGVGCRSRLVDQDCQLVNHVLRNPTELYARGQAEALRFVYETTQMRLRGRVLDTAGNAYDGAGVFATRSDGAYVTGRADSQGWFDIPITAGNWSMMATRGQKISVNVPETGFTQELTLVGVRN